MTWTAWKTAPILLTTILFQDVIGAAPADSIQTEWSSGPTWWNFAKMVFFLGVVLVLIWLTLSFLRKSMGLRGQGISSLTLEGGLALGPKRSIQIVKAGSKIYLVGATDHHLGLIAVIDDPKEIEVLLSSQTSTGKAPFRDILSRFSRGSSAGRNG